MTLGVAMLAAMSTARAGAPAEGVVACTPIKTATQLQAINNSAARLAGSYCLMNDIDLGSIPNWTPIGGMAPYFQGHFYGNGHVIKNLKINASTSGYYGLFGAMVGGAIRDVGLVNADVNVNTMVANVGALAGAVSAVSSPVFLMNIYSTGQVTCIGSVCHAGGLLGVVTNNITVSHAWSSADVTAGGIGGGLAAGLAVGPSSYERIYATGNVTGTATSSELGGLVGELGGGAVDGSYVVQAFATGKVTGTTNTLTGGLVGRMMLGGYLQATYATGAVSGGASAKVGGLVGSLEGGAALASFSAGAVSGGTAGGLVGALTAGSVSLGYWDKTTSGLTTSGGGTGKTTAQLRNALQTGFATNWGISKTLSYPFLSDPDMFTSTLATLVSNDVVFSFLPVSQSDKSQYIGTPAHTADASLAAVYTMIARAVGISDNVSTLKNVKIDKYFWHDATQTTTFSGPVASHATLGALKILSASAHLGATNVIGQMNAHRLVILRGAYTKSGGGTAPHYMLGTMYTKKGTAVQTIVANDPWTGTQVEISPVTRKVVTPGFPLSTFKVNGYRPVTTLN
jgi:hypothetical protein